MVDRPDGEDVRVDAGMFSWLLGAVVATGDHDDAGAPGVLDGVGQRVDGEGCSRPCRRTG